MTEIVRESALHPKHDRAGESDGNLILSRGSKDSVLDISKAGIKEHCRMHRELTALTLSAFP